MHTIAFNLKRAFHSFLNLTRGAFRKLAITSARFDMLHTINESGRLGIPQRKLRTMLGVTAPTVSRMVRALEELGYVTRERHADRRQLVINVTALGRALVRRAWRALSPNVDLAFDCALAGDRWWDDEGDCFFKKSEVESHLWNVRAAFRDNARLHYYWHPDD
jgi:DNA-binding MarR family transcriptional regulator